jgi:hypothetical protein
MNRQNDAVLGMFKTVDAFLTANAATITAAGVPIITTYKGDLETNIDAIRNTSEQTAKSTKGITQTKAEAETEAIKQACIVAGAVYSYAKDNNMTQLAMDMDVSSGTLRSKKDEALVDYLNNIWVTATDIATVTPPVTSPLIPYGIVPDVTTPDPVPGTLSVFETTITDYTNLSTAPRQAISSRKTYNQTLDQLYNGTDLLLGKLDRIVAGLEDSYPTFFQGYQNARIIVLISLSTQVVGTVLVITDPVLKTTQLVQNATVTILGAPYIVTRKGQRTQIVPEAVKVKTDVDGKYAEDANFHTTYTVTCEYPGYVTQTESLIAVKRGKKEHIDFVLVPVAPPAS